MKSHYGVWYDETEPTTGVIQNNHAEFLYEEMDAGINISYEEALADFKKEFRRDHDILNPEDIEEHEEWEEALQAWNDHYFEDSDTHLIGSWKKDAGGLYEPDRDNPEAEYAAIVREFNTQVVWSKHIAKVRAMCSPCYPGQADLDSGEGDILAFTLPPDVIGNVSA